MDSSVKSYHPLNTLLWYFFWRLFKEDYFPLSASLSFTLLSMLVKHHRISIKVCGPVEIWIQCPCEQKHLLQRSGGCCCPCFVFEKMSQEAAVLWGKQTSLLDKKHFTPSPPLRRRKLWCMSDSTVAGVFISWQTFFFFHHSHFFSQSLSFSPITHYLFQHLSIQHPTPYPYGYQEQFVSNPEAEGIPKLLFEISKSLPWTSQFIYIEVIGYIVLGI